jgi:hypothetical protein
MGMNPAPIRHASGLIGLLAWRLRPQPPSKSASAAPAAMLAMASILFNGCAYIRLLPPPPIKEVAGRSCQEPEELLEVLTRFTTLVQKHDYHHAIALLVPEDQARMIGSKGQVPDSIKAKMDALDFKKLTTDRRIDLIEVRLKGVFACLPCLDQGEMIVLDPEPSPVSDSAEPGSQAGLERARRDMAKDFYRKIQSGRWQSASGLVHPDEWQVFLEKDGSLSDLNERRLQAIEECDLDALRLKDGLLTGIVVLLEPPVSELYLKSMEFFDAVEAGRIMEAIGMLLESEKKFFLDPKGHPRPDRIAKLKALDREDWRKLYLYHDVLLGVAEATDGYDTPFLPFHHESAN